MHAILKITILMSLAASLAPNSYAWRLEAGEAVTHDTSATADFRTIDFIEDFDVVPIVIALTRDENAEPVIVRVHDVTTSGFDIAPIEPHNEDGLSPAMTVDYIAMEPGEYTLPGGAVIVAGEHSTSSVQAHSSLGLTTAWDTVSFGTTFTSTASVIAGLQSMNSEIAAVPGAPSDPFMAVAMRNPSTTTVQMAIERAESDGIAVSTEDIGWIAIGSNSAGSFNDIDDNIIGWDARNSSRTIVGWDSACTTHPFSSTAWPDARVIASQLSRFGNNGGWVRRCSISPTQIGFQIDEDQSNDNERTHIVELAGMLAFSGSFHTNFTGEIEASKTVSIVQDPIHGTSNAYTLPGARLRYAIEAESIGNSPIDLDSMVIADKIPDNVILQVGDIDGAGSGPVLFTDGTPPSNLTYTFGGLADLTDDVDFSNNDGATFDYIPSGSADANVTDIRVSPKGIFNNATGTSFPNFKFEFDVVVE